jgi:cytochrome c
MDSLETSKIAGAILCAALAIVLPKTLIDMNMEAANHSGHSPVGYTLPAPAAKTAAKPEDGKSGAAAPAGDIFAAVKPLFAAAKPDNGAATFKVCAACHSNEKGGANKVGPVLWGVVNRKAGGVDGFAYSQGLAAKGGEWTYDRLAGFINNPKTYVPGTKMAYAGIQDPEKLADLLAYLGTLNDTPVPLPK